MAQNYSNIVDGDSICYKKLFEEYKELYKESAAEAKEAESAIADFCEDHATITTNGTYNITDDASFEVSVASYDTVTMTVTGDAITGVPLPTVNNGNFFIYDQFAVGDHQVVVCQTGLMSGHNISSVSGDASIDHGTLTISGNFTVVADEANP